MFKILHFADLHLDASFSRVGMTPSVAKQRREELRSSLKCILNKALELGVDTITIAGDLYEHDRVSPDTMNFVKKEFEAIAPIPVVITPGNHDPFLPGSPYRQIEWSPMVKMLSIPLNERRILARVVTTPIRVRRSYGYSLPEIP